MVIFCLIYLFDNAYAYNENNGEKKTPQDLRLNI